MAIFFDDAFRWGENDTGLKTLITKPHKPTFYCFGRQVTE